MYAMLRSLHAKTETPAPGKVIFEVEANSKTMSPLPYFSHSPRMSGKGT